jgi:glycosyltransferase involved in cell wall biosynthesis
MILGQKSKQSAAASKKPPLSRLRRVSVALRSRRDPEVRLALVMLFGRRDQPTDAVRDYANCLSKALRGYGISCENSEISWYENGWLSALAKLWKQSRDWRGRRVVFHYTALMWSRRGLPFGVPLVLKILKLRGCRTLVVFHDVYAVAGSRWIDRFRVFVQERIMCHLSRKAYRVILPVPAQSVPWLQEQKARIEFIPVGANVSSLDELAHEGFVAVHNPIPTVAVFGIPTWPSAQKREVESIVQAVRKASAHTCELQLLVLGRGAKEAESLLRAGLSGTRVNLRVDGLRSSREIGTALSCCDALLFVRGGFSSRRGSGVAAIACGLPIVAYQGRETGYPLTEGGVLFVAQDDADSLGKELARVLLDGELRLALRQRNLKIFREWFSWDRIAERWIKVLGINTKDFSACPESQEIS